MTELFRYMDYRKYLKETFEELKSSRPNFSHRFFAKQAGFSSSNYILLVIQGKRNLSGEGIQKVAKALKLKKDESEFFENLVRFNQAASDSEKNFYYSRISSNRKYAEAKPLEKSHYEYYSKWFIPAIREMVLLEDFKEDPSWIASKFDNQITAREVEAAINLLLKLELITRNKEGKLVQVYRHLFSGDEITSLAVTNFQREMIERAAKSIDETPADKREIGSVTFAVSMKKLEEAKKMIREFRTRLSGFFAEEKDADAVYQFNMQLFNLSKEEKGGTTEEKI